MKMNSTTRARSSLVALVVLALIFVGLSAMAYPTLSSEDDNPDREPTTDDRDLDAAGEGKKNYASENGLYPGENYDGLAGYIINGKSGEPVAGAEVVLTVYNEPDSNNDLPADDEPPIRKEGDNNKPGNRGEYGDGSPYRKNTDAENGERDTPKDKAPEGKLRELMTKTDRRGFFLFSGLQRGAYILKVIVGDKVVYKEVVKYLPGESGPIKIIIEKTERGHMVAGKVVDERGKPVAGAKVQLRKKFIDKDPVQKRPGDQDGQERNEQPDGSEKRERLDQLSDREKRIIRERWNELSERERQMLRERWNEQKERRERQGNNEKREPWNENGEWADKKPGQNTDRIPPNSDRPKVNSPPLYVTVTGRDGHFIIKGVKDGQYVLTVQAKGFEPYKRGLKVFEDTKVFVKLKHQKEKPRLDFKLQATPVDGDGDGQQDDVMVHAWGENGNPLGGVMINIDGEHVGSTSYRGWILSLDYKPREYKVKGQYHNQEAYTYFLIKEPWNEPREFGHLKGIVFSDNGKVPEAEVELHNYDYHEITRTGREGEFWFERIPEGEYIINVYAKGYHEFRKEIWIDPGESTHLEIFLEPMEQSSEVGHLKGTVYAEGDDPEPVDQAWVELFNDWSNKATRTDEEGNFGINYIPVGEYILIVHAKGFREHKQEIVIEAGEFKEIRIVLEPHETSDESGSLLGNVLMENGGGIEGAIITASHHDMEIVYHAKTNVYGVFLIDEMLTGEYTVTVEAKGYYEGMVEVEILPDETTQITLQLRENRE